MTEWIGALPALVVALLVLFGPGALIAWALAVRGFALLAAVPVLTVGTGALLAIGYGALGIGWTPVAALAGFAASAISLAMETLMCSQSETTTSCSCIRHPDEGPGRRGSR